MTEHRLDPHNWAANHADALYAFAMARLDDPEQARDLVQEAFLAALEKISGFEGRSSERTWLTAILKYKLIDIYRKRSSGLNQTLPLEEGDPEPEYFDRETGHWRTEFAPQPMRMHATDPLLHKELMGILRRCLQKLPGLWKAVFTMKHMDEAETETICTELRITQSNCWVIIHRAKVNLRACIQKSW